MKIDKHISDLLFQYDCVIIPEFGGFVANYAPATIHPTQHIFTPPSKKIVFNKNLKNNDGLLANHISGEEKLTYENAYNIIRSYVAECNEELKRGKKFTITHVGTLHLDVERNIQFDPDKNTNYLIDSFGLTSFQSPAIKRDGYVKKLEKEFKDRPAIPYERKKVTIKKYVSVAAAITIVFMMIWVPMKTDLLKNINYSDLNPFTKKIDAAYKSRTIKTNLPITKNDLKDNNPSFHLNDENASIANISFTDNTSLPITVKLKEADTDKTAAAVNTRDETTSEKQPFHLIGGCFKILENAKGFIDQLKRKNINASIIGQNNVGLYIVSCGNYSKREEAVEGLAQLKSTNPDAWLLVK